MVPVMAGQGAVPYRGHVVAIADHNDELSEVMYACEWSQHLPSYENYADTHGWARITVKKDMYLTLEP